MKGSVAWRGILRLVGANYSTISFLEFFKMPSIAFNYASQWESSSKDATLLERIDECGRGKRSVFGAYKMKPVLSA